MSTREETPERTSGCVLCIHEQWRGEPASPEQSAYRHCSPAYSSAVVEREACRVGNGVHLGVAVEWFMNSPGSVYGSRFQG